jgi:hypothetical protein
MADCPASHQFGPEINENSDAGINLVSKKGTQSDTGPLQWYHPQGGLIWPDVPVPFSTDI